MANEEGPRTAEEALAMGYAPIEDVEEFIRQKLGLTRGEMIARRLEFNTLLAGCERCSDPAHNNEVCHRDNDMGIICICHTPRRDCYAKR